MIWCVTPLLTLFAPYGHIIKYLTHLCRVDSATLTLWPGPFPIEGVPGCVLSLPCITDISVCNANSVDPDQTPRSAASDLCLHCLPMSFYETVGINGLIFLFSF